MLICPPAKPTLLERQRADGICPQCGLPGWESPHARQAATEEPHRQLRRSSCCREPRPTILEPGRNRPTVADAGHRSAAHAESARPVAPGRNVRSVTIAPRKLSHATTWS